jgi:hypothetical protein
MKFLYLALALLFVQSCSSPAEEIEIPEIEVSQKGNWTDGDKDKAKMAIEFNSERIDYLGDAKQDCIDCYLKSLEDGYESFSAANKDISGCTSLFQKCLSELAVNEESTSVKGNWSDEDLKRMEMVNKQLRSQLSSLGSDAETFIECYTEKVINTYDSFLQADGDQAGCTKISESCISDMGL